MPLLLFPVLVLFFVFLGYKLYAFGAAGYGTWAGWALLGLVLLLTAGLIAGFIRRYRFFHGKAENGARVLETQGEWGRLCLDAHAKNGEIQLNQNAARFIFADIVAVSQASRSGTLHVHLQLNHATPHDWHIPMPTPREARRWADRLKLAAAQKL